MLSALEVSLSSGKVWYWCIYFPHFFSAGKKYYFNMIDAIFGVHLPPVFYKKHGYTWPTLQNHRKVSFGRDLQRSSDPIVLKSKALKLGLPRSHQVKSWIFLQQARLHHFSQQSIPRFTRSRQIIFLLFRHLIKKKKKKAPSTRSSKQVV